MFYKFLTNYKLKIRKNIQLKSTVIIGKKDISLRFFINFLFIIIEFFFLVSLKAVLIKIIFERAQKTSQH